MSVLLRADALHTRRAVAAGELLPLADSLRADLAPLLGADTLFIPPEKAHLTRQGGRCPVHGTPLDFDPFSPHSHRCGLCARDYTGEDHYRWWIMFYQLWLAERAVHAATLRALRGDAECGALAQRILSEYAARYLAYPNVDNVLGPTRPFFSTYLESIWTLQLTIALDLLEAADGHTSLGEQVRDRLIVPSAQLIASFDEGKSNRQVWNNAALAAAGTLLGDASLLDRALASPSGLVAHSRDALLADGTWYEGENYHLFAHRGLWYVTAIAEAQGWMPPEETERRIAEGFVAPFATALPDFTFPSRRDSQYKISLRQWRIAESCELGLARTGDVRLRAALGELYRDDVATGDTARARSTAEAERNVPAARLTRASLGWKSLLFAKGQLPPLERAPACSALLSGQGLGVMRRDDGRVYIALDYGESGGGHGHPDRLNFWLVKGNARVLEDVGTGAYVDPSLHWYRSTLAHNAPLVDGRSQWRVDGQLLAWQEDGETGWIAAEAGIAPGVIVRRALVALHDYVVDELSWTSDRVVTIDLPFHVDARLDGDDEFRSATLGGGHALEDGFAHVTSAFNMPGAESQHLTANVDGVDVQAWLGVDAPHEWWRCVAPGPPGAPARPFVMVRAREKAGRIRAVWTWSDTIDRVDFRASSLVVHRFGMRRDEHRRVDDGWDITLRDAENVCVHQLRSSVTGAAGQNAGGPEDASPFETESNGEAPNDDASNDKAAPIVVPVLATLAPALGAVLRDAADISPNRSASLGVTRPIRFRLSREHYRKSEEPWERAGRPEAVVAIAADATQLVIEVGVKKQSLAFAPRRDDNPLDNEHPDTNSDGVQLYLGAANGDGRYYSWILVPEGESDCVRVTPRSAFGASVALTARWRQTPGGYLLRCSIPRHALGEPPNVAFTLDLIVNETIPERERRRGQLVLSGGQNETIYLRGDRQDATRALAFSLDER